MSTTGLLLYQDVVKELEGEALISGTASGSGTTTTLIDSSTDSPLNTDDDAERFQGECWLYVHTGTNIGNERKIKRSGGYSPGQSQLTVDRAVTSAYDSTDQYHVLTRLSHAQILDCINSVLREQLYRTWTPLTLVTDGDMETSGVTSWTASNTTLTKATTAGTVFRGTQALSLVTTSASGYAQSASIPVQEDLGGYVYVVVKPLSTNATASVLNLILWDVTNAAAITVSGPQQTWNQADGGDWAPLSGTFTTPTGCRQIAVRLQDETNGNTSYWDDCIVRLNGQYRYPAPSWLAADNGIFEDVEYYHYANDYRSALQTIGRSVLWADIVRDNTAANPIWIEVDSYYSAPLFVKGMRRYPELSGDTATTPAPRELVVAGALTEAYRRLMAPRGTDVKVYEKAHGYWRDQYLKLCANQPRAHIRLRTSRPH